MQFKCQLVEKAALFDVGFDQEASFLVKLVGQMPEFSDRYDWSGLRLGQRAFPRGERILVHSGAGVLATCIYAGLWLPFLWGDLCLLQDDAFQVAPLISVFTVTHWTAINQAVIPNCI